METLPDHQREIMSLSSQLYVRSRRSHVSRLHHKYTLHRVLRQELYRRLYRDHLCAFRCLAVHQGHFHDRLETHTKTLFSRWIGYLSVKLRHRSRPKKFPGSPADRYTRFRKMFQRQCQHLSTKRRRRGSIHLQIHLSLQRHLTFEFIRKLFVLHLQSTGIHQKISVCYL